MHMSIHRPKRATFRKADDKRGDKPSQLSAKTPPWQEAIADKPDDAFLPYAPAATFAADALVSHPKFGKGVVVGLEPGKVAILFEEGVKKLVQAG
jgi:hypothetical protein